MLMRTKMKISSSLFLKMLLLLLDFFAVFFGTSFLNDAFCTSFPSFLASLKPIVKACFPDATFWKGPIVRVPSFNS